MNTNTIAFVDGNQLKNFRKIDYYSHWVPFDPFAPYPRHIFVKCSREYHWPSSIIDRYIYIYMQIRESMYSDYRKRMGYTQKEVAERSRLSVFIISSFENDSSTGITLASFFKLLRAIDSLDEIE